jgi:hypothetical protein
VIDKSKFNMKKVISKIFGITFLGVMFLLASISVFGQLTQVEPGDASIDSSLLNTGKFTWELNKSNLSAGNAIVAVERNGQEIKIIKRETSKTLAESEATLTLNAKTFETIRKNFKDDSQIQDVQYGTKLRGTQTYPETGKVNKIDEPLNGKRYFDEESLPFIVSMLPLRPGYQASLPYYSHNFWTFKPKFSQLRIAEVTERKDYSCVSGFRDIWEVKAFGGDRDFKFFIDKATRRIIWSDVPAPRQTTWESLKSKDKETDINPIKTRFDAAEANAMIKGGTATIQGQAWTRAGLPSGSGVFKGNKKQYAPKGTIVALIPITPYFKELYEFNLRNLQNRDNCGITKASPEVEKATLVTDVIDDKGNFVFKNLKPGEYWVLTTFVATKYSNTTRTPDGYMVTVTGEGTAIATQTYDVKHWGNTGNFDSFKAVKVNKEGETVKLKLDN